MSRVLSYRCRGCGEKVEVEEQYAGMTVSCPFCAKRAKVAVATKPAPAAADRIKFACGSCGHRQYAEAARAGEKVKCESCGAKLRVPGTPTSVSSSGPVPLPIETSPEPTPLPKPRRPSSSKRDATPGDAPPPSLDVFGFSDAPRADPDAGPAVDDEGSSLVMPLPSRAHMAPSTFSASPGVDGPKKRKRKQQRQREEMKGFLAFGFGAFVVMAALIGLGIALPNFRFALALILIIPGGLLTLLGNAAFRQVIAEEGFIQMLLCRFVPLYIFWFAARRWSDVKDHIMLYMLGMCLLGPGLLMMWLSPELHGAKDHPFRKNNNPAAKGQANPGMPQGVEVEELDPDDL